MNLLHLNAVRRIQRLRDPPDTGPAMHSVDAQSELPHHGLLLLLMILVFIRCMNTGMDLTRYASVRWQSMLEMTGWLSRYSASFPSRHLLGSGLSSLTQVVCCSSSVDANP